jgi:DNA-binding CsgD family transcriptional regulator
MKPSLREIQIADLISQGMVNKEIAHALGISPSTVIAHRANLYRKIDARSQGQMVRFMIQGGYIGAAAAREPVS